MEHHSTGKRGVSYDPPQRRQRRDIPSIMRRVTLGVVVVWLALVASLGGWIAQRLTAEELDNLSAGAEYEAQITGRVVDRLFTEMASVANMVARQSEVIQLAARYRHDPPGFAALTREERAANFTRDPLVRSVGDFMDRLASDLHYGRIYMNNLSDDTVTASNWAESFSIVGQIYTGRAYLLDALRTGSGEMFGIARLNKTLLFRCQPHRRCRRQATWLCHGQVRCPGHSPVPDRASHSLDSEPSGARDHRVQRSFHAA
ncbi:hypothetical protein O4O02_01485 [Pseudomonas fortuita]